MKDVMKSSFWQLAVIYVAFVVLISFGLVYKFTYHFEIFALILGIIGIFVIKGDKEKSKFSKKWKYVLLGLGVLFILVLRIVPYVGNEIPLGYDAGIYKYGIESFSEKGFGITDWERSSFTPGFLYSMKVLNLFLSSDFLIKGFFIFLFVVLGISVWFFAKEEFGEKAGMISFLLYCVSVVQFKVFSFMYYKNVIALIFLIWAFYFFKKSNWKFVIFSVLVGLFHRPTFFIFGLGFVLYCVWNYKEWKNFLIGFVILLFVSVGYIGFWDVSILPLFEPVIGGFAVPGNSGGTFISFFDYQFTTLAYLPFAILGFGFLAKRKEMNLAWFVTLVCGLIVYFQFFFFNRFIIHLDLMLILFAGFGFSKISLKKFGNILIGLMIISAGFVAVNEAIHVRPLISQEDFDLIGKLDADGKAMAVSGSIAPWVLAYSGKETIAPGLFGNSEWDKSDWERFWSSEDEEEIRELMSSYGGKIYLFAPTEGFNKPCFDEFLRGEGGHTWYEYVCENER